MRLTTNPGERIAVGVRVNGALKFFGGGQESPTDTPFGSFSAIVHLNSGDVVQLASFTVGALTFGSPTAGHGFWFQGEYLGS